MKYWRLLTFGVFVPLFAAVALVAGPVGNAHGWASPTLTAHSDGCAIATVTLLNPEGSPATITATSGGAFTVGQIVPGNGSISGQVTGAGAHTVTVTVNFPDHAYAETSFTLTECPPETTTSTTPPTTSPNVSTIPPHVQCKGDAAPHERTTGPEPCTFTVATKPQFTG